MRPQTTLSPSLVWLKQALGVASKREAAQRMFDEFASTGLSDAELELAATYYGWTLFELDEWRQIGEAANKVVRGLS
jgi:hypothetical protein